MSKRSSARVAFLLLLIVSILAVLAHHISAAGNFEGFDSDELDDADDPPFRPSPPPPTVLAQPSTIPSPPPPPPPPPPSTPSDHPPLDLYDEDEFEGIPLRSPDPDPKPQPSDPPPPPPPPPPASYALEISCLIFLTAFAANYFLGRHQNERMALSFASILAAKNSTLDKNFNLLLDGADAPMLLKEGRRVFKFYGAGRRHCRGFSAIIELRARHDLIATASDLLFSKRDVITFEVVMNEDAMDPVVLALAKREEAKGMQSAERDLRRFASAVATSDSGRKWVAEDLVVMAESKEVAGDLITDVALDQVFGENIYEKFEKWFISLHFSDQHQGSHKKMLIFKFALPAAKNMADMTRLVALVPYYTDLIGRYKLSPQARSKTEASRAKAAQEVYKELHTARQDTLQKRKVERKKWIEEAEAMLSAEVIRKKEATNYSRQPKKSMPRVKMLHSL